MINEGQIRRLTEEALLNSQSPGSPSDERALAWLGRLALENHEWDAAEMAFSSLLERRQNPSDLVGLAESLLNQFRLSEAEECLSEALNQILEPCPLLFAVCKYLGQLSAANKNFPMAEEYYNRAYTLNPDSPGLQFHKALLSFRQKNYREAAAGFQALLKIRPKMARAWLGLALSRKALADKALRETSPADRIFKKSLRLRLSGFAPKAQSKNSATGAAEDSNWELKLKNQAGRLSREIKSRTIKLKKSAAGRGAPGGANQLQPAQNPAPDKTAGPDSPAASCEILEALAKACLERCLDLDPRNKTALDLKKLWNPPAANPAPRFSCSLSFAA